jgi:hypothetical protein
MDTYFEILDEPIIHLSNAKDNETKIIYVFTPSSCVDFDI